MSTDEGHNHADGADRHAHDHAELVRSHLLGTASGGAITRDVEVPSLKGALASFNPVHTIPEVLRLPEDVPLDSTERRVLLSQLMTCLGEIYVHRDLKRTRHAVDPVTALRWLHRNCDDYGSFEFHQRIMEIFKGLRDQHTGYIMPKPWQDMIAFLPFLLGACVVDEAKGGDGQTPVHEDPCVIVTGLLKGFEHPDFKPGVEVLTWNGLPIDRAVRRAGRSEQAANSASEFALGVRLLTVRWLGGSLPPEEYFVTIGYVDAEEEGEHKLREIRFAWNVVPQPGERVASIQGLWDFGARFTAVGRPEASLEQRTMVETALRGGIFAPILQALSWQPAKGGRSVRREIVSVPGDRSDMFRAWRVTVRDKDQKTSFGLIRIVFFGNPQWGMATFLELLKKLPQEGLVIDLRSNPGGEISAAELMLQALTDRQIEPLPFQFLANDLTESLATQTKLFQKFDMNGWRDRIKPAVDNGSQFSRFGPLTPVEKFEEIRGRYPGPSMVLTDAVTYSSGDIFAASFQDHEIGPVLGVDPATGGGGANVWDSDAIWQHSKPAERVKKLPGTGRMHMAVRRCTRVGARQGIPIEEAGVTPDLFHRTTRNDLMHEDADLMARICDELLKLRAALAKHQASQPST